MFYSLLNRREFLKRAGYFLFFSASLSSIPLLRLLFPEKEKLIRPPGAVVEERFLAVCMRCGKCVEACPTRIIKPLKSGFAAGTPYVDFSQGEICTSCMKCTEACPTNALMKIGKEKLDIGTAGIDYDRCNRCFICFDYCPVEAFRVEDGWPKVIEEKCIGCNICSSVCPISPTAITVKPEGAYRPEWSPP